MATPPHPVLLLTRPAAQSARFARSVEERLGPLDVVTASLIDLCFLDAPIPGGMRGVIFTSENGVRAYARLAKAAGQVAWCVGDRTAEAARAAGFAAQSAAGDAEALAALLIAGKVKGPLLHVRGVHARGHLAERLNSADIETREAVLYDQRARPLGSEAQQVLAGATPVLAPLFSPRTARLFAQEAQAALAPLHIVALSPAVAGALDGLPRASLDIAKRPDAEAMIAALAQRLAALRPG